MPVTELMIEGLRLLLIGMGIVFGFLIVLVFAMKGMSRLALALGGQPRMEAPSPAAARGEGGDRDDNAIAAVIGAAIARYRSTHR